MADDEIDPEQLAIDAQNDRTSAQVRDRLDWYVASARRTLTALEGHETQTLAVIATTLEEEMSLNALSALLAGALVRLAKASRAAPGSDGPLLRDQPAPHRRAGAGRWLLEVRDDGGRTLSRIDGREMAHGGSGPDLHIPGVHGWFDQMRGC